MDIRFLNEKKFFSVCFQCEITDRRNDEVLRTPVFWLEPEKSEYCEKHAWSRIINQCETLGYTVERTDDTATWRKVTMDKKNLFNTGEMCNAN